LKKCEFLSESTEFVGHILSYKKINIPERVINKLSNIEYPKTIKRLQRTLGFFNYLKKFIYDYSSVVKRLFDKLKKTNTNKITYWAVEDTEAILTLMRGLHKRNHLSTPN
jgi:hypothetical protein